VGVQDPLAQLVQLHAAGVLRYLRSLLRDEEIARDLLQETFLKLEPRAATAGRPLVYAVARSCAIDHLRRLRTRRRHEAVVEPERLSRQAAKERERPDARLAAKELRGELLRALAKLPETQRSVFHLSEIEGFSYAEIAQTLGLSPGTVASRKYHAVRKLRSHLGSYRDAK
jgi:RNA polymerase sigma-70 factor (ECF subfamily)